MDGKFSHPFCFSLTITIWWRWELLSWGIWSYLLVCISQVWVYSSLKEHHSSKHHMVLGCIPTVFHLKPKCMMNSLKSQSQNTGNFVQILVRLAWVRLYNKPHCQCCVVPLAIHEGFPQPILISKPTTLKLTRSSQKTLPPQIPRHMHCGWGLLCFKSHAFSYLIVL